MANVKSTHTTDWALKQLDAVESKQDIITDLPEIREDSKKGASAYQLPSTGIPKADMSEDVKASLSKADTALQGHQDISGLLPRDEAQRTYQPKGNYLTQHQDISHLATKAEVTAEETERKAAINAVNDQLATKASQSALDAERTERTQEAEAEATTRANADAELNAELARKASASALEAEVVTRANADTLEAQTRANADTAEASARQAADTAEANARAAADEALQNRCTALESENASLKSRLEEMEIVTSAKGASPLVITDSANAPIKSLKVKGGLISQNGVPTPDDPKPILIGGKELKISADGVPYVEGSELVVGHHVGLELSQGTFNTNKGNSIDSDSSSSNRVRSQIFAIPQNSKITIVIESDMEYIAAYADPNNIALGVSGWKGADDSTIYNGSSDHIRFLFRRKNSNAVTPDDINVSVMLGDIITIPLPLLIGDDEADITKGEVVRKWGVVDLGSLDYNTDSGSVAGRRFASKQNINNIERADGKPNMYSSLWAAIAYKYTGSYVGMTLTDSNGFICSCGSSAYSDMTAEEFKDSVKGVLLVFPLATPTPETIPPATAPLIKPTSVLTSYVSEIEAEYVADPKNYIDNKLASLATAVDSLER